MLFYIPDSVILHYARNSVLKGRNVCMLSNHFDELTKVLAGMRSRREAIKILAVNTLSGIFLSSGIAKAFAQQVTCRVNGSTCKHASDCCSSFCLGNPNAYCVALIGTPCKHTSDCCGSLSRSACGLSCSHGKCA